MLTASGKNSKMDRIPQDNPIYATADLLHRHNITPPAVVVLLDRMKNASHSIGNGNWNIIEIAINPSNGWKRNTPGDKPN